MSYFTNKHQWKDFVEISIGRFQPATKYFGHELDTYDALSESWELFQSKTFF